MICKVFNTAWLSELVKNVHAFLFIIINREVYGIIGLKRVI